MPLKRSVSGGGSTKQNPQPAEQLKTLLTTLRRMERIVIFRKEDREDHVQLQVPLRRLSCCKDLLLLHRSLLRNVHVKWGLPIQMYDEF
ncbi:hypothetical protein ANN_17468 [Periplaneta americana]|uniref:Uncharacterized protein n=1 Tax=Periplaneta americana TaxID=6978 RepID=A0ABQ8SUA8_PERAM|nr:hypothetical protein ANN_17468 [Periplaneta americana]